ncbi:MAG: hypothetical protein F6J86_01790 [Symploca sp. SIO1B1]|nr:hypothetical protein [Symploca sp. SIO1A3]NER92591.1 hypothetical protein [Symploca sp. SIO1B1]
MRIWYQFPILNSQFSILLYPTHHAQPKLEFIPPANRAEQVLIVPIGIQYRYIQPHWVKLDELLSRLEADTGLPVQRIGKSASSDHKDVFYQRLFQLGEYLLYL